MDGDIGDLLRSVMSDPEQMARVTALAQGLMAGGEEGERPSATAPSEPSPPTGSSPVGDRLLSLLGKNLSDRGDTTRSAALLRAMRPYMKPEKQEKLDRAMQVARMVRVAGAVLGEFGGDRHGL